MTNHCNQKGNSNVVGPPPGAGRIFHLLGKNGEILASFETLEDLWDEITRRKKAERDANPTPCDGNETGMAFPIWADPAILGASALILIATAATIAAPFLWSASHCRPYPQHQNHLEVKAERCGR